MKSKSSIKFYVDAANPQLKAEKPSVVAQKFGIDIIVCGESAEAFNKGDEVFVSGPSQGVRGFGEVFLVPNIKR